MTPLRRAAGLVQFQLRAAEQVIAAEREQRSPHSQDLEAGCVSSRPLNSGVVRFVVKINRRKNEKIKITNANIG